MEQGIVLWAAKRYAARSKPRRFSEPKTRATLSISLALRTSPCRGPNPSVDRRVRWMRRAPGWQGAPDGQQAKKLVVAKCLFYCKINIL